MTRRSVSLRMTGRYEVALYILGYEELTVHPLVKFVALLLATNFTKTITAIGLKYNFSESHGRAIDARLTVAPKN